MPILSHQVEGKRFGREQVDCGGIKHNPPVCKNLLLVCDCGEAVRVSRAAFDGSHVCPECGGGDFVAIHGRRR